MRSPMPPYRRRQFLKGGLALAGLGLLSGWAIMLALGPPRKPASIGYPNLARALLAYSRPVAVTLRGR